MFRITVGSGKSGTLRKILYNFCEGEEYLFFRIEDYFITLKYIKKSYSGVY